MTFTNYFKTNEYFFSKTYSYLINLLSNDLFRVDDLGISLIYESFYSLIYEEKL